MKEEETVETSSERLITVVNKIRLMGEQLPDSQIVEKMLVSLPGKFEAKISSLEDQKMSVQ